MAGSQSKFNSTLPTIKESGGEASKPGGPKIRRRNTINTEMESGVSSNLSGIIKATSKIASLKRIPSGSNLTSGSENEKCFLKIEDATRAGQTVTRGKNIFFSFE